jgi:hypothetical protein
VQQRLQCFTLVLQTADEAMRSCASMLQQRLCTVGPRVAYLKHKKPGRELPHCSFFARADAEFCRWAGLDLGDLQAFKPGWAASTEGMEACRHDQAK